MSTVKLTATFELPGTIMYSKEEVKENKNLSNHETVTVKSFNKKTKKLETETLHIFTRKCKPVYKTVKMTDEAYDYMTGDEAPIGVTKSAWKGMSKKQKLACHLNLMAEDEGSKFKEFHIFE